jgi:uncharacterized protein
MVTAPPEDGKANTALIELLAKTLRLAKRDVSLVAGAADRRKTIRLAGNPEDLLVRVEAAIQIGGGRTGGSQTGGNQAGRRSE